MTATFQNTVSFEWLRTGSMKYEYRSNMTEKTNLETV